MPADPPLILFVCTGNICRSPLAERVLRHALAGVLPVGLRVESAGTHAVIGAAMDEPSARIAGRFGADTTGHYARKVSPALLSEASIVLTATRAQRSEVVQLYPRAVKHAWTMRQVGAILQERQLDDEGGLTGSTTDRLAALVTYLTRHRGLHYRPNHADDDVVDPYLRSQHIHESAAHQMLPALSQLSQTLGGPPLGWPLASLPTSGHRSSFWHRSSAPEPT